MESTTRYEVNVCKVSGKALAKDELAALTEAFWIAGCDMSKSFDIMDMDLSCNTYAVWKIFETHLEASRVGSIVLQRMARDERITCEGQDRFRLIVE